MDTLFTILKKGLVATIFIVFGFTMTYVPQLPTSHVPAAEAGGAGGISTSFMQTIQNASALAGNATATITAGAVTNSFFVNNVLDGLAWGLAKQTISGIVRSTIDWVNSGFSGSPAFIQDFRGFMTDIADAELGRFLGELGGLDSFICSPFRLDVQISVALQYQRGAQQQTAPKCTLTGIIDNIEGFIAGVDPGNGLADWFTITSNPMVYTPYGAALSAQANLRARIINAQGEERTVLGFGDGFQSQKICRSVSGFTGSQDCSIVKPGRVIADQLNKALGAGQDSLVEADEINELISALLGQVAQRALQGTAGLLGLSGGDGFGGYAAGPNYLDDLYAEQGAVLTNTAGSGEVISDALSEETEFRNRAQQIRARFSNFLLVTTIPAEITAANNVILDIDGEVARANANIVELNTLATSYGPASDDERVNLLIRFSALDITGRSEAADKINDWNNVAVSLGIEL